MRDDPLSSLGTCARYPFHLALRDKRRAAASSAPFLTTILARDEDERSREGEMASNVVAAVWRKARMPFGAREEGFVRRRDEKGAANGRANISSPPLVLSFQPPPSRKDELNPELAAATAAAALVASALAQIWPW